MIDPDLFAREPARRRRARRTNLQTALAFVALAAGIAAGIYVGGYVMLIGGIVQAVNAATHHPPRSAGIAWGVVRVMFSGLAGWLCVACGVGIAHGILED
jgi:hypothetical protein